MNSDSDARNARKFDDSWVENVKEDVESMANLTKFALLGGENEYELIARVAKKSERPDIRAYSAWLLGNDSAWQRIKSKNWFVDISEYASLEALNDLSFGSLDSKYRMPPADILMKFMRIGHWPSTFEDLDVQFYDQHFLWDGILGRPQKADPVTVYFNFFCRNPDLIQEMTDSDNPRLLQVENKNLLHVLFLAFYTAYIPYSGMYVKPTEPDDVIRWITNWDKIYVLPTNVIEEQISGINFSDDQLLKNVKAIPLFAKILGSRLVKVPEELMFAYERRDCWINGVKSAAIELVKRSLAEKTGVTSSLSPCGFIPYQYFEYYRKAFKDLDPILENTFFEFLFHSKIRIYYNGSPLNFETISKPLGETTYAEAANFVSKHEMILDKLDQMG